MPTALERQGDFSQTTDNNGDAVSLHQGPAPRRRPARAANQTACFATAACSARFRRTCSIRPGLNILNLYPLPNIDNVPAGQNYNYTSTRPAESIYSWQPAVRVDYQASHGAARRRSSTRRGISRTQTFIGTIPGFNDTRDAGRAGARACTGVGQLHADADDVPRSDLTAAARTSWPAARRRSRAPARSSATTPAAARAFR